MTDNKKIEVLQFLENDFPTVDAFFVEDYLAVGTPIDSETLDLIEIGLIQHLNVFMENAEPPADNIFFGLDEDDETLGFEFFHLLAKGEY